MADITDGTSKTMLLAEVRVGLNRHDIRGVWALSTAGASSLYWHGWHFRSVGSANGPNNCGIDSDHIGSCLDALIEAGGDQAASELFARECMQCATSIGIDNHGRAGSRSRHRGGVHAAYCDGHVDWIDDRIQTSLHCCSAWDRLILSADGEVGD
jgi:prepilin-type processing-associated H-X9-DG protein